MSHRSLEDAKSKLDTIIRRAVDDVIVSLSYLPLEDMVSFMEEARRRAKGISPRMSPIDNDGEESSRTEKQGAAQNKPLARMTVEEIVSSRSRPGGRDELRKMMAKKNDDKSIRLRTDILKCVRENPGKDSRFIAGKIGASKTMVQRNLELLAQEAKVEQQDSTGWMACVEAESVQEAPGL